jgi:hypothetical protein
VCQTASSGRLEADGIVLGRCACGFSAVSTRLSVLRRTPRAYRAFGKGANRCTTSGVEVTR